MIPNLEPRIRRAAHVILSDADEATLRLCAEMLVLATSVRAGAVAPSKDALAALKKCAAEIVALGV